MWRKKSWKKGYTAGKKEHAQEVKDLRRKLKSADSELEGIKAKQNKEKLRIQAMYQNKIKNIYKRMDYRIEKAEQAIVEADSLLNKLKMFETWVVTTFQKSIQSQSSFIEGLTTQTDDLFIEQEKVRKKLHGISHEKNSFFKKKDIIPIKRKIN